MKVYRFLVSHRVREMCVKYGYYTCGDNDSYSAMLNRCKVVSVDVISDALSIAKDIYNHSNIEKFMREYGCDDRSVLETIVFNLYNDCCITFVEVDEDDMSEVR